MNGTESPRYASVQVTFREGENPQTTVLDFQGVVPAGNDTDLGVVGSSKGVYRFTATVHNATETVEEFTFDHWNGLFRVDIRIDSNETGEPEVRIFRRVT